MGVKEDVQLAFFKMCCVSQLFADVKVCESEIWLHLLDVIDALADDTPHRVRCTFILERVRVASHAWISRVYDERTC